MHMYLEGLTMAKREYGALNFTSTRVKLGIPDPVITVLLTYLIRKMRLRVCH